MFVSVGWRRSECLDFQYVMCTPSRAVSGLEVLSHVNNNVTQSSVTGHNVEFPMYLRYVAMYI